MDQEQFDSLKDYVGFSTATSAVLRDFHAIAQPHFGRIIDDFYEAIEAHSRAREVITGGKPQIERLKRTLLGWINTIVLGPHDLTFLESHSRIGRVHVRIGLPQEYMFSAMNRIRSHLIEVAHTTADFDTARRRTTIHAVNQILDLELAIMLDTYSEHLNDKIRGAERLATIGQLAATIGHELRNPLSTIESSLFLLDQRLKRLNLEDDTITKHRGRISNQVSHCGKIITNLLDLARDRRPNKKTVNVRDLVRQAMELAHVPKTFDVQLNIPDALTMYADSDDMLHVLVNLLANAVQAKPEASGNICISADDYKGGTELRVADDGPGVPHEIRNQIFDALFTTKSRGTGLGLALCRRVMLAHGGEIQLEPSPQGASFRLWIPDGGESG